MKKNRSPLKTPVSKDEIADAIFFKKYELSFTEVHLFDWTNGKKCAEYVRERFKDQLTKSGLTRRSNKLWQIACRALTVKNNETIENSVWCVTWKIYKALKLDIMPSLDKDFYPSAYQQTHIECYDSFEILGYVSAPDISSASVMSKITLGPRAHHDGCIEYTRIGIGGWEKAKLLNEKLVKRYENHLKCATKSLEQKKWEIEQSLCQLDFLTSKEQ